MFVVYVVYANKPIQVTLLLRYRQVWLLYKYVTAGHRRKPLADAAAWTKCSDEPPTTTDEADGR